MDPQMPKLPGIKAEVNKEEEEKKRPGFLVRFLSRLGGGGPAAGGLGSPGLAGGLMATKAGVVGLVLAGTTVAGGIGVVSYKVFGPGADRGSKFMSIFEARPKTASGSEGESSGAPKDGASASLDYLVKANVGAGSQGESDPAQADASAAGGGQNGQAGAPSGPVGTAQNLNAAPGGKANPSLKTDKKFGELSKLGGGAGASSGASSGGAAAGAPANLIASAKLGSSSAMSAGRAAGSGRNLRGLSASRRGGSFKQLGAVHKDQIGARSSSQAGATYDGNRAAASTIGADAGMPEGGAGTGGKGAAGRNQPATGSGAPDNRFPSPPPAQAKNVTPWQQAINTAAVLIAVSCLLLLVAGKIAGSSMGQAVIIAKVLASLAGLIGIYVIALGAQIGGGQYGQQIQGGMLALAGGLIVATAAMAWIPGIGFEAGTDPSALMLVSGGAALAAAMAAYLIPPHVYPPSEFENGRPPDQRIFGYHKAPSQDVLKEYLT